MFNIFKRERSYEDLEATKHIFMAGWREGYPCEGDHPTPSEIDRNHPDFKRGLQRGSEECHHLQQSHPHLFVNGVLRNDSGEE